MAMGGLATRFATGIPILIVALALIWLPSLALAWVGFVALVAGIGLSEYSGILRAKGLAPERVAVVLGGVATVLAGSVGGLLWTCGTLFMASLAVGFLHVRGRAPSIAGIAGDMFGLLYVGWFPAHVVLIHREPGIGPGMVTVLIVAVALTDIGAYFVGKGMGKRKLAPVVSPNKTWEGAIGGTVCTLIGMTGAWYVHTAYMQETLPAWPLWAYLGAGVVLSVSGQVGDLVESSLKRDAGVKDAGTIFPGHGGVLDRFDGFLFAAPVLYYGLAAFA